MIFNNSIESSSSAYTLSPDKRNGLSSVCSPASAWTSGSSTSSSPPGRRRQLYSSDEALSAANSMPAILENGRKVFGPPRNYVGPRPSYVCELYVTHIPRDLDELGFLFWLHRCGTVYEFRLMMDSCSTTRGYAFVRFTCEEEALAAYEMFNFRFISGERLRVYRSQGKNRLYVSNIPRALPVAALEMGFRKAFPEMQSFTAYPAKVARQVSPDCELAELNRGFAFIEFYDHETAMEAKKRTTPGRVRMWSCDLKVQWAKPKVAAAGGGVDPKSQLGVSPRSSFAVLQNDYCAKLRLYCLANDWCVPIVVYGDCCRRRGAQYGGILLKNPHTGAASCVLLEVLVERGVQDVHLLLCEVAVQLLERGADFPSHHFVLRALNGTYVEQIHSAINSTQPTQMLISATHFAYPAAMRQLAATLQLLAQYSSEAILKSYKYSFCSLDNATPTLLLGGVAFYSILPKFRNNPPLSNDFNDTEVTLLLMPATTSAISDDHDVATASAWKGLRVSLKLRLKSQRNVSASGDYVLRYVDEQQLMTRNLYHPAQRCNSTPIFIPMQSFQKSIFKWLDG